MKDVLLAFSGGIDSCASVDILRSQGFRVHLFTIDMVGDQTMLAQAQSGAKRLGLELHIEDGRDLFRSEIINNFTSEYLNGRTPAPCTRCNTKIKWELLAQRGDQMGIHHIATGHYFRVAEENGHYYAARGLDPRKDQSYYLWGVKEHYLKRAVTPMGDKIKEIVKATSLQKSESMGVCFLRGTHYADWLCSNCSGTMVGGDVVDREGQVVGEHNGIARYTIGQRRGDGIPAECRVVEIDSVNNKVIVGDNSELYCRKLHIDGCHFIDPDEIAQSSQIEVMVRGIGRNPKGYARVICTDNEADIELLDDTAWAVAPGQPVVLYIGDRVVGGGYLK